MRNLAMEYTAMVVAIGEYNGFHPQSKKELGTGLGKAVGYLIYKKEYLVFSGPVPEKVRVSGTITIIGFP